MNVLEFAEVLLRGEKLEDKLISPKELTDFVPGKSYGKELSSNPGRSSRLKFSDKQIKFPKKTTLNNPDKAGLALHFFANHELLAIEMMAAAILKFSEFDDESLVRFRRGLVNTIADEQKHFKMYQLRMNELGVDFGDFPLNDFFWRQMHSLKTPSEFYALMALTFEQANLDFASSYRDIFIEHGDEKTGQIMQVIYEDEISHVALGANWLSRWREDKSLWDYYLECLPEKITPSRGKGIAFDRESRQKAGLSSDFINNMENYRNDFPVTNRRSW